MNKSRLQNPCFCCEARWPGHAGVVAPRRIALRDTPSLLRLGLATALGLLATKPGSETGSKRGAALVMAIVAAIVVSLTAVVVMNLTFQRFHLSHFRSDRVATLGASEAGLRYAFKRLEVNDTNRLVNQNGNPYGPSRPFKQHVIDRYPNPLVVSSLTDTDPVANGVQAPDHWEPNLQMGTKHVTVRILWRPPSTATPPYLLEDPEDNPFRVRINAFADYGE